MLTFNLIISFFTIMHALSLKALKNPTTKHVKVNHKIFPLYEQAIGRFNIKSCGLL